MIKASIITAVVMALVTTACGGESEVATTEAAVASTGAPVETTTTTVEAPAASTTTQVETTTTTGTLAPVVVTDGTVGVTLTNWAFAPTSIVVTSGEPIVVTLENLSTRSHNWAILTAGSQWTSSQDLDLDQILASTQGIPADGTDTLQFTAPEPGTYQVVCTVTGHIQQGMVAELVVVEG
ncbi:MAG: cupredoxin domain-containing protein [Acidimicrobiia bacterium]